jgi:hypothetical protein
MATEPTETVLGAGMGIVPVYAVREALVNGIAVLVSDERAMLEMVGRSDALAHARTDEWQREMVRAIRALADPQSPLYAEVRLGYPVPLEQAHLPALSIVEASGGENGENVHGDVLRESYHFVGPDQELWATTEVGTGYSSRLQIGAWAEHPETAMVLHAMSKWAMYQQKDRLFERGVHDVSIQTDGSELDPRMGPRVTYVPMVSVSLSWTLRQSFRRKIPNRVSSVTGTWRA